MRFYYPDIEEIPLPPGHRFPGGKYRLLRARIEQENILPGGWLFASPLAGRHDLLRAHADEYVDAVLSGSLSKEAMRRIGLPWSETLVRRSRATVGGAIVAAQAALESGLSGQLAGGTHHAHRDFGSGFCVFNDLAVAALTLLERGAIRRIAIVDLDVHQGDGNAAILADDPRVFLLSMHGEKNFPFRKVASTLDIGLADGTDDAGYLQALVHAWPSVEAFRPELILYLAGADALAQDKLGRLSLTHAGLVERDRFVFEHARRQSIAISIAVGGGYADPIDDTVTAYANTFRVARDVLGV